MDASRDDSRRLLVYFLVTLLREQWSLCGSSALIKPAFSSYTGRERERTKICCACKSRLIICRAENACARTQQCSRAVRFAHMLCHKSMRCEFGGSSEKRATEQNGANIRNVLARQHAFRYQVRVSHELFYFSYPRSRMAHRKKREREKRNSKNCSLRRT